MKQVISFVVLILLSVCFLSSVSAASEADGLFVIAATENDNGDFSVTVSMNSISRVEYLEFDIIIPDGFILYYYEIDKPYQNTAELIKNNDSYRFVCYSSDGNLFQSNQCLLRIVLSAKQGTSDGEYEVRTENAKFFDSDKNAHFPENSTGKIQLYRNSGLPQQTCEHEFDGWTVTKAPTYETEGEREKICKKCNKVCKTLTIAKIQKRDIASADLSYNDYCICTGKALTPDISLKYKGLTLSEGVDYTVEYSDNISVGTGAITIKGIGAYEGVKTVSFSINPGRVTGVKLKSRTDSSITLKWNKVEGADKYIVYIYKSGSWKKAGESTKPYFKIKNLSSGKKYKFKVRAESKGVKGNRSAVFGAYTKPDAVKVRSISVNGNGNIKIRWTEVKSCDGYLIYVKLPGSKKYKLLKTIKGSTVTSYVTEKLTAEGDYSFKIRSYINSEKTKIFSSYSRVANITRTRLKG